MSRNKRINSVLFCGGNSSRMGFDKALMNYQNKGEQRVIMSELLFSLFDNVIYSLNERQMSEEFYQDKTCVKDKYPGEGPMGGLLSVIESYPDKPIFALAIDMPNMNKEVIEELIKEREKSKESRDATVYYGGGRLQPLCAIYESSFFDKIREQFLDGNRGLTKLLNSSNILRKEGPSTSFTNINNQGELYESNA